MTEIGTKPVKPKGVGEEEGPRSNANFEVLARNNFTRFRDALSNAALNEYVQMGRMIRQERLERPVECD
jgi:hypothetical protein